MTSEPDETSAPIPRVSIVLPNYNHARFLRRRLESIFGQTLQDFELLFLDDASTDESLEVFASFSRDPRVSAHVNEVNGMNPFKQWNRGVRRARAPYVWIAESDDFAAPKLLAELVARLDAHPHAGLAYCQSSKVDESGRLVEAGEAWTEDLGERWSRDFVNRGTEECRRYLVVRNTIPNASAVVFRRDVFLAAGGAVEGLRYAGDWMTWVRMLLRSDVCFAAEPWNSFRKHEGTVTHGAIRDGTWAEEGYRVLAQIRERLEPESSALERALDGFVSKWVISATLEDGAMEAADHRRVYEVARAADPRLLRRLVRHLKPHRPLGSLALLARVLALSLSE